MYDFYMAGYRNETIVTAAVPAKGAVRHDTRKDAFGRDVPAARARSPTPEYGPPPNSRLFLGNLATDKVTREQVEDMFNRYGRVLEVSMHQNFGFVQFGDPETAQRALEGENRKIIKGLTLDISLATNRGKKGNARPPPVKEKERERESDRCIDFSKGFCRRGNACRFVHEGRSAERAPERSSASGSSTGRREPCKDFAYGKCRRGDHCKYLHEDGPAEHDPHPSAGGGYATLVQPRPRSPPPRQKRPAPPPDFDAPPSKRVKTVDVEVVLLAAEPVARDFADTVGAALAEAGLYPGLTTLGARQQVPDVLSAMASDGVKYAVIVDPITDRPTVTLEMLYQGPQGTELPRLGLYELIDVLKRDFPEARRFLAHQRHAAAAVPPRR